MISGCLKYPCITLGPEHKISPSSAIFTFTPSSIFPTLPILTASAVGAFAEITGEVSVRPYPSQTRILAAQKILASRGCSAAAPEPIIFTFPPSASRHLLNTTLLAIFNCRLYHQPMSLAGSYFKPRFTAQKNIFLPNVDSSYPFEMILSYTFSRSLGTVWKVSGFISLRLSAMVSMLSA